MPSPDDALLRRIERRSLWLTAVAAGVALVWPGGGSMAATAVVGGALMTILSYLVIKRSVYGLTDRIVAESPRQAPVEASAEPGEAVDPSEVAERPRRVRPVGIGMFIIRHALLAGIAYVMIARLRLPPFALLGGASVIVLAAAGELLRRPRRS